MAQLVVDKPASSELEIEVHDQPMSVVIDAEKFPLLAAMTQEERTAIETKLRWKVDFRLLPILVLMYIMNYLDRNTIAQAKLGGLVEDLGLTDSQYLTCVAILNAGYLLMQVPSNIWLNKFGKPGAYISCCMVVWGAISTASGATHNFAGLFCARFFLGFVEAAFYPGAMFTLSTWYKREELSKRMALFYTGSQISGAFSGLIAGGVVFGMDGLRGLRAWRWLFLLEGAATILIAMSAFFILPNFPQTTKWLTPVEKEMAVWRLQADITHAEWTSSEEQITWKAFIMAMKDWRNWFFVAMVYGTGASLAVNNFFPSVLATLGRGRVETLLLTSPPFLLSCITMFIICWNADRTQDRYWHFTIPLWFSLAGFIIVAATTNFGARYFGAMIMIPGIYSGFNMAFAWTANTIYGPPGKRAVAIAFNNAFSGLAGLYSAYLYPSNAAPRYAIALGVSAGMVFMAICAATALHFLLARENRKIEKQEQESNGDDSVLAHPRGFRFLT
ncbi:unnamed protein product [Clonostachys solani]|uniref:Major facilitator superfamily (MFS) profile domain-containing protein n=1 Tax=Clonostachys solani TaxID=160281 RepID=A0A9N9Z084_9HYPO|nr:unnamed protein product [Clonostachys solani]